MGLTQLLLEHLHSQCLYSGSVAQFEAQSSPALKGVGQHVHVASRLTIEAEEVIHAVVAFDLLHLLVYIFFFFLFFLFLFLFLVTFSQATIFVFHLLQVLFLDLFVDFRRLLSRLEVDRLLHHHSVGCCKASKEPSGSVRLNANG